MSRREGYRWRPRTWAPSEVEERVLDGVARGLTNPEIASEVGMSVDGVKWHVGRALSETALGDRYELGRWWRERAGEGIAMSLFTQPATRRRRSRAASTGLPVAGRAVFPALISRPAQLAPRAAPSKGARLRVAFD